MESRWRFNLRQYPQLADFRSCFQSGRTPAASTNGLQGMVINPGGGFGFPTVWSPAPPLYGFTQWEFAFRFEGTSGGGGNSQIVDITFDAGQVTQPGTYTGQVKARTNDPVEPTKTVDVTMHVNAPADWGQLSGVVTGLGYCNPDPDPPQGARAEIAAGVRVETAE